ncbi:MAG: MOSC domain-containing protein [Bacteroidia bacterium]
MDYQLSGIYTYPIKSLGGIALSQAKLGKKGLEHDRRWMLADEDGLFMTQRTNAKLALFQATFVENGLKVSFEGESIIIPFEQQGKNALMQVEIWGEKMLATKENETINTWFSAHLGKKVYLVRDAQSRYTTHHADAPLDFPDACPYLVVGQNALNYLNEKLPSPIQINRFRPNFVFTGGEPHIEDNWLQFQIGNSTFQSVKSCARCNVITIDQTTGITGKEPTKTLSTYRQWEQKIWFGRYVKLLKSEGFEVKVGDALIVDN